MEHNSHEYTFCPECGDTVLDINMIYDEDGAKPKWCSNCERYNDSKNDPGTIHEYDLGCGDYDPYDDVILDSYEPYEPNPYDGTYSEM